MFEVLEEALKINREALKQAYKNDNYEQQQSLLLSISMLKDSLLEMYEDEHIYDRRNK